MDGSTAIEASLGLSRLPSPLSEQVDLEDSAASMFPPVEHQLDQVLYQAQQHEQTDAVHTDKGCVLRASSVSCGASAGRECNTSTSFDRTTPGDSQGEPDRPPLFSTESYPAIEPSHHNETVSGKQDDITGSVSSDEGQNSSQGETSRHCQPDSHE